MEKIFLFHCSDTAQAAIRQAAANLKISCSVVPDTDYTNTLTAIVQKKHAVSPFTAPVPNDSLLLICGFSGKRLDKLLAALKKTNAAVDFKAVLTPANETWTLQKLLLELHREKAAMAHIIE